MSDFVKTPMSDLGKSSPRPSGSVQVNGKVSTIDLPERSMSKDGIPEVFYDENGNLPKRG